MLEGERCSIRPLEKRAFSEAALYQTNGATSEADHRHLMERVSQAALLMEQRKIAQELWAEWILSMLKQSSLPHLTEPPRREKQNTKVWG